MTKATKKLNPCPSSPNCVCSMYPEDAKHYLEPWNYQGNREEAYQKLLETLQRDRNVSVEESQLGYIHVSFRIPVFGYVDDVEFLLPAEERLIHFRSSSRVGYHDLGVNKRRMNRLKKKFKKEGLDLS